MTKYSSFLGLLACLFLLSLGFTQTVRAQSYSEVKEGTITEIGEKEEISDEDFVRTILIELESGDIVRAEEFSSSEINSRDFQEGDRVYVSSIAFEAQDGETETSYAIVDFKRTNSIYLLFVLFLIVVLAVSRLKGILSILGLIASFFIINEFLLENIIEGADPIISSLITATIVIPITFYISHGFNRPTSYALIGTITTLMLLAIFTFFYIDYANLTGFGSEDTRFVLNNAENVVNIRNLLIASVVVGLIGALDDISISQAHIARELKETDKKLNFKELYIKTMNVGKEHISSLVNTLFLVYASASLPLMILLYQSEEPIGFILNDEIIAEEVVRILITSIGLILAVPITTAIASYLETRKPTE